MLTLQLARQAQALARGSLSERTIHAAKLRVLDMLGCSLGGLSILTGTACVNVASRMGGKPEATLLGSTERVGAEAAAFSNGTAAHALCYDDTDLLAINHPSSSIVAGALAAAEQVDASGKALLAAVIAGYQVTLPLARTGAIWNRKSGFHGSGIFNAPGTAMAVSEIYKLDEEAASRAIGLAVEQGAGLCEYRSDSGGLAVSAFHCGHSAMAGVLAAQLAREGFPAPRAVLEGRFGFFRVVCGTDEPPKSLQFDLIAIEQTSLKGHPVPHVMPGVIDAARIAFRKLSVGIDEIKHITVKAFKWQLSDFNWQEPKTLAQAELSTQFNVVVGLAMPVVHKEYFDEPYISDPRLKSLCSRVTFVESPEATAAWPKEWHHEVTIELKDGRSAVGSVTQPKGHPDNPMSDDEIEAKFRSMADKVIGEKAAAGVVECVRHLEDARARDLGDLLRAR